jgi:hypothetical protein
MRIFLVIFFVSASFIFAQTPKRPNQLANLKFWVKADSVKSTNNGNQYTDGAAMDTVYNWGSFGGYILQTSASSKPIYRANATLPALPAMEMDGTDNFGQGNQTLANYNFCHDGRGFTTISVFYAQTASRTNLLFNTAANSSSNSGFDLLITSGNKARFNIAKAVGGATYIIALESTNTFSGTGQANVYVVSGVYNPNYSPDTAFVRVNGVQEGVAQATNLLHSRSNSATVAISSTTGLLGFFLEACLYSEVKTTAELAALESHFLEKWAMKYPEIPKYLDLRGVIKNGVAKNEK